MATSAHVGILKDVNNYYTEKVKNFGAMHRGVDWNSVESQQLRFEQLLKLCDGEQTPFSLNDYGCGYGAMALYMAERGFNFEYYGFDISEAMIDHAQRLLSGLPNCKVFTGREQLPIADYTVASGIFNVKLDTGADQWKVYVLDTLGELAAHSRRGFAFNMLTAYSDPDRMRPDLYYGDPLFYFDFCRRSFSRHVALLHDYRLYEFTMLVRLDSANPG